MLTAYYITEVEDQNLVSQLESMEVGLNVSKAVKIPSDNSLLAIWAKTILETERNNIDNNDFVILDGNMNDKFGYYMMLGMAIGKNSYKGSITVLNDEFANKILADIYLHKNLEHPRVEESIQVGSIDQTYYNQNLITFVANNSVDSVRLNNNIDRKEPAVAILLGICYSRGIAVDYTPESYNLFIDLIVKR